MPVSSAISHQKLNRIQPLVYIDELANLVREGKVEESLIDDATKRILNVKFELGLLVSN